MAIATTISLLVTSEISLISSGLAVFFYFKAKKYKKNCSDKLFAGYTAKDDAGHIVKHYFESQVDKLRDLINDDLDDIKLAVDARLKLLQSESTLLSQKEVDYNNLLILYKQIFNIFADAETKGNSSTPASGLNELDDIDGASTGIPVLQKAVDMDDAQPIDSESRSSEEIRKIRKIVERLNASIDELKEFINQNEIDDSNNGYFTSKLEEIEVAHAQLNLCTEALEENNLRLMDLNANADSTEQLTASVPSDDVTASNSTAEPDFDADITINDETPLDNELHDNENFEADQLIEAQFDADMEFDELDSPTINDTSEYNSETQDSEIVAAEPLAMTGQEITEELTDNEQESVPNERETPPEPNTIVGDSNHEQGFQINDEFGSELDADLNSEMDLEDTQIDDQLDSDDIYVDDEFDSDFDEDEVYIDDTFDEELVDDEDEAPAEVSSFDNEAEFDTESDSNTKNDISTAEIELSNNTSEQVAIKSEADGNSDTGPAAPNNTSSTEKMVSVQNEDDLTNTEKVTLEKIELLEVELSSIEQRLDDKTNALEGLQSVETDLSTMDDEVNSQEFDTLMSEIDKLTEMLTSKSEELSALRIKLGTPQDNKSEEQTGT